MIARTASGFSPRREFYTNPKAYSAFHGEAIVAHKPLARRALRDGWQEVWVGNNSSSHLFHLNRQDVVRLLSPNGTWMDIGIHKGQIHLSTGCMASHDGVPETVFQNGLTLENSGCLVHEDLSFHQKALLKHQDIQTGHKRLCLVNTLLSQSAILCWDNSLSLFVHSNSRMSFDSQHEDILSPILTQMFEDTTGTPGNVVQHVLSPVAPNPYKNNKTEFLDILTQKVSVYWYFRGSEWKQTRDTMDRTWKNTPLWKRILVQIRLSIEAFLLPLPKAVKRFSKT